MGELEVRGLGELLLEPPRGTDWVVEDLISVGLHLLVGPPKVGKSWLSLLLALSVTAGEPFLGFATAKAGVLYLALEDTFERVKQRSWKLVDEARGAGDVTVAAFGKHLAQHAGFMLDRGVGYRRAHAVHGSVLTLSREGAAQDGSRPMGPVS